MAVSAALQLNVRPHYTCVGSGSWWCRIAGATLHVARCGAAKPGVFNALPALACFRVRPGRPVRLCRLGGTRSVPPSWWDCPCRVFNRQGWTDCRPLPGKIYTYILTGWGGWVVMMKHGLLVAICNIAGNNPHHRHGWTGGPLPFRHKAPPVRPQRSPALPPPSAALRALALAP